MDRKIAFTSDAVFSDNRMLQRTNILNERCGQATLAPLQKTGAEEMIDETQFDTSFELEHLLPLINIEQSHSACHRPHGNIVRNIVRPNVANIFEIYRRECNASLEWQLCNTRKFRRFDLSD